jgi:pyruvate/2-oxoglutarate dehydrogenase complex dihydrolipoamide dehydrogenase (E3) component
LLPVFVYIAMTPEFDLTVIGGGAAGLVASQVSAYLGARTALIESHRMGGDRTWTGCIPSKALLKAAQVAHLIRTANRYGIAAREPEVDFKAVLERVHSIREQIYQAGDAPEIFERRGIKVFHSRAKFVDPHTLQLSNGQKITSRYFVIAAGSVPLIPKIEGIETVPYMTNESLFEIDRLPERLIVVGGGPMGVEMAQAFQRLGSRVTMLESDHRVLNRDDAELSYLLEQSLRDDGIDVRFGATVERVEGNVIATLANGGRVEADAILFSTGRRVDVSDLDLRSAGIRVTEYGVSVDEHCRTAVKHIYAAGDVTGRHQFTHMAEHMAKVAVKNALLGLRAKLDSEHVTWCTYSDPELAHVGASEDQIKNHNQRYDVYKFPYSRVDRAVAESEATGLIKVFATPRTGKILGASILGANAGEMIAEFALAMKNQLTLREIASTIHPYPAYVFGNRRVADQWTLTRRVPRLLRALRRLF